jgi:hypothetical protein
MKAVIAAALVLGVSFWTPTVADAASVQIDFSGTIISATGEALLTVGAVNDGISGHLEFDLPTPLTSAPYGTTGVWTLLPSGPTGHGASVLGFNPADGVFGQSEFSASISELDVTLSYTKSEFFLEYAPSVQTPFGYLIQRGASGIYSGTTTFQLTSINAVVTPIPSSLVLFASAMALCSLFALSRRTWARFPACISSRAARGSTPRCAR